MQQKPVHRSHHVGMGVEGPAGEADLRWSLFVKPSHQVLASADYTNGKPAAQRLAVGDEIGRHAEKFLCSTDSEAKSDEHLIENQDDVLSGADRAQSMEPLGVGLLVEMRFASAVDEGGIRRCVRVGMQCLQRVDQHTGDVAPPFQQPERIIAHISERVSLVRGYWIADTGLHIAPPAVVGATKPNEGW